MSPKKALLAGLVLTVLATAAPLVNLMTVDSIGDHVRSAYPDWSAADVSKDRTAITAYLVVVGVLGLVGWLTTLAGVSRGKRWTRWVGTTLFAVGATVALIDVSVGGEAYKTIVPPFHGTLGLLPALAGLVAVVALWRRPVSSRT
ncbi:hypothetical protein [Kribbella italica]|uniref:DUF998 domain-containing protein n=1 Tax=Kribbella italica TaxID=1540520 RepID=A0A7W9MS04_9ACTN|nr:hypothetical protein [Kribbella italica]MBB5833657.1 hypothetical protein [Kribbella italica]